MTHHINRMLPIGLCAALSLAAFGCTGDAGPAGAQGTPALLKTSAEAAGANCASGGTKIESGLDTDGDGSLAAGEVTSTAYVCDGTTGADGADGAAGTNGTNGTNGTDGADGDDGADGADGADGLCAGAARLAITDVTGIEPTYYRGFQANPITVATNAATPADVEVTFLGGGIDFTAGANTGEYTFTPSQPGDNIRVLAVATDGCTIATRAFTIPKIEVSEAKVRFVHLFPGAGDVEVLSTGDTTPLALLSFADSSDEVDFEGGDFTFDIKDINTDTVVATSPSVSLAPNSSSTIVVHSISGNLTFTTLTDDVSDPAAGAARIRGFHAADGVGQVDLHIATTPPTPVFTDIDPGTASAASEVAPGPYTVGLDVDDDGAIDFFFQPPPITEGSKVNYFAYMDGARPMLYVQVLEPTAAGDTRVFSYNGTIEVSPNDTTIAAAGASITLTGTLEATDPTWYRPSEFCTSGTSGKYFDAVPIVNATLAPQTLTITADWTADSFDGFLHIFDMMPDGTSAATSRAGCIDGSDDDEDLTGTGRNSSKLTNVVMQPGERIWVIASTYSTSTTGAWSITVESDAPPAP